MKTRLYQGKAKSIYTTDDPNTVIMHFRDDASAFDGVKKASLANKGKVNNLFNAHICQTLENAGIKTHFIERINDTDSLVKKLDMLPIECVVRNIAAGSLCKRLGIKKGEVLNPPVFEFFYKDDSLHDPMITASHIATFGWATSAQIDLMQTLTHQVNTVLKPLFDKAGFKLVDYKLEFGIYKNELILGDEFTPDGCRLWDTKTNTPHDKDRFRFDIGEQAAVIAAYQSVYERLI